MAPLVGGFPVKCVIRCDALDVGRFVPDGSVELAYLDPPFSVGVEFGARTRAAEVRARGVGRSGPVAYDDRWSSLDDYLGWLASRVAVVKRLLSKEGTMWLHLDHRAVHEAKVLSDGIFGRKAFAGEVVWVPGNGSKGRRSLGVTHQTILVYRAGDGYVWNDDDPRLREPFAATSLSMHFKRKDATGRSYRERTIKGKTYRYYADVGRALGSVWTDCPAMVANTPIGEETTGYPTQKPMKLLERIIAAASRPGALVLDPFCGSGTTLAAAAALGRAYVGCDVGELAIETTLRRLRANGHEPDYRS